MENEFSEGQKSDEHEVNHSYKTNWKTVLLKGLDILAVMT